MNGGAIDRAVYRQLLLRYEPLPIDSESNTKALAVCAQLAAKGDLITPEETAILKIISVLIEDYELNRFPAWNVQLSGAKLLAELIEEHGLKQSNLAEIMPQSRVSDTLAKRRQISKAQALALGERFEVNPAAFLR